MSSLPVLKESGFVVPTADGASHYTRDRNGFHMVFDSNGVCAVSLSDYEDSHDWAEDVYTVGGKTVEQREPSAFDDKGIYAWGGRVAGKTIMNGVSHEGYDYGIIGSATDLKNDDGNIAHYEKILKERGY